MSSILVVDDDKVVRTLLERTLTSAGHKVKIAVDGAKAVSIIEEEKVDLAIVDILLPGILSGFKVISKTKSVAPGIKILAVTGHGRQSHEKKAIAQGADSFMVKPVKPKELLKEVDRLLELVETVPLKSEKSTSGPAMQATTTAQPSPAKPAPAAHAGQREYIIFRSIPNEARKAILQLGQSKKIDKNAHFDVDINSIFVICKKGRLECNVNEKTIYKMGIGDVLGENLLFPYKDAPLHIRLSAKSDSEIIMISKKELMNYLKTSRNVMVQFMANCLTTFSEKFQSLIENIEKGETNVGLFG